MKHRSLREKAEIDVLAERIETETPWDTVGSVLSPAGRRDLIETIADVYPQAFAAMCDKHQAEIDRAFSIRVALANIGATA